MKFDIDCLMDRFKSYQPLQFQLDKDRIIELIQTLGVEVVQKSSGTMILRIAGQEQSTKMRLCKCGCTLYIESQSSLSHQSKKKVQGMRFEQGYCSSDKGTRNLKKLRSAL